MRYNKPKNTKSLSSYVMNNIPFDNTYISTVAKEAGVPKYVLENLLDKMVKNNTLVIINNSYYMV